MAASTTNKPPVCQCGREIGQMTEFRHFNPRAQTVTKLLYWQCACGVTTTATISGETSEVLQDGSTLGGESA